MNLLTQRQLKRIRELEDGYRVVAERNGSPIFEGLDGGLVLVQPDGRLATTGLISGVRSHLNVDRS